MATYTIAGSISAVRRAGKRGVDTRDAFVLHQEEFQDDITNNLGPEINTVIGEMNTVIADVNSYAVSADTSKNTAISKATEALNSSNDALTYRNDAVAAKEAIDGYVIPTEATLSPAAINDLINKHKLETFLGFNF